MSTPLTNAGFVIIEKATPQMIFTVVYGGCNLRGVCDVDAERNETFISLERGKKRVDVIEDAERASSGRETRCARQARPER